MVKLLSLFSKDPKRPLILLETLVFLVAAGCITCDVIFFVRSAQENYGLLIWRIPLESAVCLTYLLSLANQAWHVLRAKHKTIGKRRLFWIAPVIVALVIVTVADMVMEMNRVKQWRNSHPDLVTSTGLASDRDALRQFWTCGLLNEFYESSSTSTRIHYGLGYHDRSYCVPRNFGWGGAFVLALVFVADVAYTYAKRHQLQAMNEMSWKREQEEEEEEQEAVRRKSSEAHVLANVPSSKHPRTAGNLLV